MNVERLVREIERRLAHLEPKDLALVVDSVREEAARERDFRAPGLSVETERERRVEAETLREALEAITREPRLRETLAEVLKQLSKLVRSDSCALALAEADGLFRMVAARGVPEPQRAVGATFREPLGDAQGPWPVAIADAQGRDLRCRIEGGEVRSWAGVPLVMEGEVLGLLCLQRAEVDPFDDEEMHRARAFAFSAAAAIRKAQLLEEVRRYATLMERVVAIDQAVFSGQPPAEIAKMIVDGALAFGNHGSALLAVDAPSGLRVEAASGELAVFSGRELSRELLPAAASHLASARDSPLARATGVELPDEPMHIVPVATPDELVGALFILDPDGETPDDRLLESYASRGAGAYLHAAARPVQTPERPV
jgi:hypothetical protein